MIIQKAIFFGKKVVRRSFYSFQVPEGDVLELPAARRRCFGVISSQKEMFWSYQQPEGDVLEVAVARRRCFGAISIQKEMFWS